MKNEYIETHFVENPSWKKYFLSKFPDWTAETWKENVCKLFVENGYTCEILKYKHVNAVKYATLYDPKGEDIAQMRDLATSDAVEQLLIHVICDHIVDFNTFK